MVKTTRRALLAEMDRVNRAVMGAHLRAEGYTVRSVTGLQEALRVAQDTAFDLAVCDLEIPGMDGLEFRRRLAKGASRDVPILFLTERVDRPRESFVLRDAPLLLKPVPRTHLRAALAYLGTREERRMRREGAALSGSLLDYSVADLARFMERYGLSGRGSFVDEDRSGWIQFSAGQPASARVGQVEGVDAFHRLLRWNTGAFQVDLSDSRAERSIQRPLVELLLEGLARAEQWEALRARIPGEPEARMRRTDVEALLAAEPQGLELAGRLSATPTLQQVMACGAFETPDALAALVQALESGRLGLHAPALEPAPPVSAPAATQTSPPPLPTASTPAGSLQAPPSAPVASPTAAAPVASPTAAAPVAPPAAAATVDSPASPPPAPAAVAPHAVTQPQPVRAPEIVDPLAETLPQLPAAQEREGGQIFFDQEQDGAPERSLFADPMDEGRGAPERRAPTAVTMVQPPDLEAPAAEPPPPELAREARRPGSDGPGVAAAEDVSSAAPRIRRADVAEIALDKAGAPDFTYEPPEPVTPSADDLTPIDMTPALERRGAHPISRAVSGDAASAPVEQDGTVSTGLHGDRAPHDDAPSSGRDRAVATGADAPELAATRPHTDPARVAGADEHRETPVEAALRAAEAEAAVARPVRVTRGVLDLTDFEADERQAEENEAALFGESGAPQIRVDAVDRTAAPPVQAPEPQPEPAELEQHSPELPDAPLRAVPREEPPFEAHADAPTAAAPTPPPAAESPPPSAEADDEPTEVVIEFDAVIEDVVASPTARRQAAEELGDAVTAPMVQPQIPADPESANEAAMDLTDDVLDAVDVVEPTAGAQPDRASDVSEAPAAVGAEPEHARRGDAREGTEAPALAREPAAEPLVEPALGASEEPALGASDEPALGASEEPTLGASEEPTFGVAEEPTAEPLEEPTFGRAEEPPFEHLEAPPVGDRELPRDREAELSAGDAGAAPKVEPIGETLLPWQQDDRPLPWEAPSGPSPFHEPPPDLTPRPGDDLLDEPQTMWEPEATQTDVDAIPPAMEEEPAPASPVAEAADTGAAAETPPEPSPVAQPIELVWEPPVAELADDDEPTVTMAAPVGTRAEMDALIGEATQLAPPSVVDPPPSGAAEASPPGPMAPETDTPAEPPRARPSAAELAALREELPSGITGELASDVMQLQFFRPDSEIAPEEHDWREEAPTGARQLRHQDPTQNRRLIAIVGIVLGGLVAVALVVWLISAMRTPPEPSTAKIVDAPPNKTAQAQPQPPVRPAAAAGRPDPVEAQALYVAGRLAEAERAYRALADQDPDDEVAHVNLASVLIDRGQDKEARVMLEAWVAGHPMSAEGQLSLAVLLHQEGKLELARVAYERFLESAPPGHSEIGRVRGIIDSLWPEP